MKHEEYLRAGQLSEALSSLQDVIRAEPANSKYRILLFQLLCVMGQWERALKQLDVLRGMDASTLAMVHLYRTAIACEMVREQVFQGERSPVFIGQPAEWQALLLQTLPLLKNEQYEQAQILREQAFELAPNTQGSVDDVEFSWLADADSRLGPTLEVIMEGGYRWIAYEQIASLTLERPEDLRDLVWLPAQIQWPMGTTTPVLIPTRYPNSAHRSNALALSRQTDWDEFAGECYVGYGQRVFISDVAEHALLDVQKIQFINDHG